VHEIGRAVEYKQRDHERRDGAEPEQLEQSTAACSDVRGADRESEVEQHRHPERDCQQPEVRCEPTVRITRLLPQRHDDFDEAGHRERTQHGREPENNGLNFHGRDCAACPKGRVKREVGYTRAP